MLDIGRTVIAEEVAGEIIAPESLSPTPDDFTDPEIQASTYYEQYIPEDEQIHPAA